MAEKRMFSKTIIDSDAFLDMPLSTQSLYFHLSMRADDDGFLNNVKKIQRMIGASGDDLKILFAKKFLLSFPDGVCVVKHWRMHNYIAKDRYKPTNYEKHKMALIINENGSYSQKSKEKQLVVQDDDGLYTDRIQDDDSLYTDRIQDDDSLMTQIRLDKIRLDKSSTHTQTREREDSQNVNNYVDNRFVIKDDWVLPKNDQRVIQNCRTLGLAIDDIDEVDYQQAYMAFLANNTGVRFGSEGAAILKFCSSYLKNAALQKFKKNPYKDGSTHHGLSTDSGKYADDQKMWDEMKRKKIERLSKNV